MKFAYFAGAMSIAWIMYCLFNATGSKLFLALSGAALVVAGTFLGVHLMED